MRRLFIAVLSIFALANTSHGQYVADTTLLLSKNDMQWWRDAKFGLFIHYGLYAIPGRGEWVMWNERIDTAEYSQLRAGSHARSSMRNNGLISHDKPAANIWL